MKSFFNYPNDGWNLDLSVILVNVGNGDIWNGFQIWRPSILDSLKLTELICMFIKIVQTSNVRKKSQIRSANNAKDYSSFKFLNNLFLNVVVYTQQKLFKNKVFYSLNIILWKL